MYVSLSKQSSIYITGYSESTVGGRLHVERHVSHRVIRVSDL